MIVAIEVNELPKDYMVAWRDEKGFNQTMDSALKFETIEAMLTEEQIEHIDTVLRFYEKHFGEGI